MTTERARVHVEYRPEPWQQHAACRGYPTEWFYTEHNQQIMDQCRRLCDRCPVKQECLDAGLRRNELGIWGGLSSDQRGRIRSHHAGTIVQLRCAYCHTVFDSNAQVSMKRIWCSGQCRRNASYHRVKEQQREH